MSPLVAGLALAALTLGWPISARQSGRLFYLRLGFRDDRRSSASWSSCSGALRAVRRTDRRSSRGRGRRCFVIGLGLGPRRLADAHRRPVQRRLARARRRDRHEHVPRSLGSAVGVAVFGAVANAVIAGSGLGEQSPAAIQAASGAVFIAVVVATVVTIAGALAMPRSHVDDVEHRPAEVEATTPGA